MGILPKMQKRCLRSHSICSANVAIATRSRFAPVDGGYKGSSVPGSQVSGSKNDTSKKVQARTPRASARPSCEKAPRPDGATMPSGLSSAKNSRHERIRRPYIPRRAREGAPVRWRNPAVSQPVRSAGLVQGPRVPAGACKYARLAPQGPSHPDATSSAEPWNHEHRGSTDVRGATDVHHADPPASGEILRPDMSDESMTKARRSWGPRVRGVRGVRQLNRIE